MVLVATEQNMDAGEWKGDANAQVALKSMCGSILVSLCQEMTEEKR